MAKCVGGLLVHKDNTQMSRTCVPLKDESVSSGVQPMIVYYFRLWIKCLLP